LISIPTSAVTVGKAAVAAANTNWSEDINFDTNRESVGANCN
jgi:hypothetical protein